MTLARRSVLTGTVALTLSPAAARADAKRQSLVDQSLRTAQKVITGGDFPDALKMMSKARGVLIIPELVQGGFILGAAGGRGVMMSRTGKDNWSYPAFYGMGSGSIGLQIGGKVSEIVFIILTEKGLLAMLEQYVVLCLLWFSCSSMASRPFSVRMMKTISETLPPICRPMLPEPMP